MGGRRAAMAKVCSEQSPSIWLTLAWRAFNALMSLFFALAAYVQINDPDAGMWMVGYGIPAFLCALVTWSPQVTEYLPWRRVADLHVLISSAIVTLLFSELFREGITNIFQHEEGREFSGLLLTVVWLLLCRHSGRSVVGILRVITAFAITIFPFVAWLYYYINKELRTNWPSHCKNAI